MNWHPAQFHRPDGRRLVCTLCPFACALHDGDTGRCHVRRRRGDALETATFATAIAHVHPIERKPLYHFHPGSRALTLAAPGCTFRCTYCQNFRISQLGRDPAAAAATRAVTPEAVVTAADRAGAHIAFSYAEPVLAAELTLALAPLARARGVALVWKTNGFVTPEAAAELAPALAAVNVDLKHTDDDAHRRLTGAPIAPVLEAVRLWRRLGVWVELSTPLIPGFNTDPDQLRALARAVRDLGAPWHLLRFHPDYRLRDAPPTHPDTLRAARDLAVAEGVRHVYVERALGEAARHTYCPNCGHCVVRRDIWALRDLDPDIVASGRCRCGRHIPGRWSRDRRPPQPEEDVWPSIASSPTCPT